MLIMCTTLHCYSVTLTRMPCSFSSPNSTRNSCSCRRKANQAFQKSVPPLTGAVTMSKTDEIMVDAVGKPYPI